MFKGKVLMITGGTGSFGNAVLKRFLETSVREIRIFSRDEKKQEDMRIALANDKVKFYIGDVRDSDSSDAVHGGRRLRLSCGGAQAGAVLRVLPHGSGAHERAGYGKRAQRGDRDAGEARGGAEHGQGGVPDQRDGNLQGDGREASWWPSRECSPRTGRSSARRGTGT